MRKFIIIGVALVFLDAAASSAWWFKKETPPPDHKDEQRIAELELRLQAQQQEIDKWRTTSFGLGAGGVVLLIIGTAIGSKGRRDAERN